MPRVIKLPPKTDLIPEYIQTGTGHINVQLTGTSREKFRQLHADLVAGARFKDGTPVTKKIDVLHWLLEQADLPDEQSTKSTKSTKKKGLNGSGPSGNIGRE